ncbi:hypothetical protein, partial [Photobacterium iliopiscarium]|uniref:hypothetical protein n=1 Tax=Photobacterium iliopiscarium TaxID=56192 RepID=UPI0011B29CE1
MQGARCENLGPLYSTSQITKLFGGDDLGIRGCEPTFIAPIKYITILFRRKNAKFLTAFLNLAELIWVLEDLNPLLLRQLNILLLLLRRKNAKFLTAFLNLAELIWVLEDLNPLLLRQLNILLLLLRRK